MGIETIGNVSVHCPYIDTAEPDEILLRDGAVVEVLVW